MMNLQQVKQLLLDPGKGSRHGCIEARFLYTAIYKEANRKITYDRNNGFSLSYVFPSKPLSYFLSEHFKLFCTERWSPLHT